MVDHRELARKVVSKSPPGLRNGLIEAKRRIPSNVLEQLKLTELFGPTGPDIQIRYDVDTDGTRAAMVKSIADAMREDGAEVFTGGTHDYYRERINVREEDVRACVLQAVELFGVERVLVKFQKIWQTIEPGGALDQALLNSTNVDCIVVDESSLPTLSAGGDGTLFVDGLWLEVISWTEFDGAYGKSYMETRRSNTVAKRLRPATFKKLAKEQHHMGSDLPPAALPAFPIDVVYTWVDGDDPEWVAKKVETQAAMGIDAATSAVVKDERFRNRDELKYSLRSIERFAPWVRTIHIVTASQCPDWLNVDHPKIRLVDHSDIYLDPEWLPTFNSSGIETQLHHVPGLADKFLYFNDDFFLGRACAPSDFFYGNGVIKYFPSSQKAYERDIDETSEEYIQADKNAIELFAERFGSTNRDIMQHVPYPSDRLVLEEMERNYPEEFAACASAPFRSSNDLRPIAFMQYHYGFHDARAMPDGISHRYLALWKEAIFEQLNTLLVNNKRTFCINDVGLQPERTEAVNNAVLEFLEAYFPDASAFEK